MPQFKQEYHDKVGLHANDLSGTVETTFKMRTSQACISLIKSFEHAEKYRVQAIGNQHCLGGIPRTIDMTDADARNLIAVMENFGDFSYYSYTLTIFGNFDAIRFGYSSIRKFQ
ncbi:hypothetical protein E8E14_001430 [Neopestalotiopsis sp. 37M]|nr:hypothetical protein E8E14_001430 [Neopestalotiopsis sp. 37M]